MTMTELFASCFSCHSSTKVICNPVTYEVYVSLWWTHFLQFLTYHWLQKSLRAPSPLFILRLALEGRDVKPNIPVCSEKVSLLGGTPLHRLTHTCEWFGRVTGDIIAVKSRRGLKRRSSAVVLMALVKRINWVSWELLIPEKPWNGSLRVYSGPAQTFGRPPLAPIEEFGATLMRMTPRCSS